MKIVLFVIETEADGAVTTFSQAVPDTKPETLRAVLKGQGFITDDVHDVFVIDGELDCVGEQALFS